MIKILDCVSLFAHFLCYLCPFSQAVSRKGIIPATANETDLARAKI